VGFLSQTGERVAALAALTRRALDPHLGAPDRFAALDLLLIFQIIVDEQDVGPDEDAPGWELDDSLWRPARPPWSVDRIDDVQLRALGVYLRHAFVQIGRHDPRTAALLIERFVRDRDWPWMQRARLLRDLPAPLAAVAGSGIRMMAGDPGAAPASRVALVVLSGFRPAERDGTLRRWVHDPDETPGLRHAALDALLAAVPAVAAELAGDPGLEITLRIAAARRLPPAYDRIRAMAAEHRRPRDRAIIGLTLAGFRAAGIARRLRARYRRRKGSSDVASDHQRTVGDSHDDVAARAQK
jgi:hypothetical protein